MWEKIKLILQIVVIIIAIVICILGLTILMKGNFNVDSVYYKGK